MHKTTQTITTEAKYTVEGPNSEGQYQVTYPSGAQSSWLNDYEFGQPDSIKMVNAHIASLPKAPTAYELYKALQKAYETVAKLPYGGKVGDRTALTEAEAIELLALLGKVSL